MADLEKIKPYTKPINFNAQIKMVHGKQEITDNKKGFDKMAEVYGKWIKEQYKK